jgi:predicted nuclease of predicted toxin-antitoxin system
VRLFIDENLSPRLVAIGHEHGYDATCARDRDLLGAPDRSVLAFCVQEDRVCVTNNADDFEQLVGDVELHPGLIVLPNVAREVQLQLLDRALEFIEEAAKTAGHGPRDVMLNHVVHVDESGACALYELPAAQ